MSQLWCEDEAIAHLEIACFEYLKTPQYSWTFRNSAGGSFSNSGMHASFRKAIQHAKDNLSYIDGETPVIVVHVTGFAEDDSAIQLYDAAVPLAEVL